MKTQFNSAQFMSILATAKVKVTENQASIINEEIEKLNSAVDKFDPRVLKRVLLAKGSSYKEAATYMDCDTQDIQIQLGRRAELGDTKNQPYWSITKLKTSKYAEISYTKDEFESLVADKPSLKAAEHLLVEEAGK